MSQKKNNQDIVSNVSNLSGEFKNTVNSFIRALHDTVVEGLQKDGTVEIDNFGTFSTVSVAAREGVNVSNGEKITIPEFTKFSFAPLFPFLSKEGVSDSSASEDDELLGEDADDVETEETTDTEENEPASSDPASSDLDPEEDIIVEQPGEVDEDASSDQNDIYPEEPEQDPVKEKPADGFSGIDVLISTPESLEETKERLEAAKQKEADAARQVEKAQEALEQAKLALVRSQEDLLAVQEDVRELSQTLENVENNRKAVIDNGSNEDEDLDSSEHTDDEENVVQENIASAEAESKTESPETPKAPKKKSNTIFIAAAIAAALLITVLSVLFCSKSETDNTADLKNQKKEKAEKQGDANGGNAGTNGQMAAAKKDSLAKDSAANQKPQKSQLTATTVTRVDTVVFDGTRYLEHIVTDHYGEHDMVYKVIQFNRKHGLLKDINHIPVGSNILLPHYE